MTVTASPLMMPRRKTVLTPAVEVVYTTVTGQTPRGTYAEDLGVAAPFDVDPDPHCFVCHRHTDHFAEHDALVDAGLAYYAPDGSVHRSETWDEEQARRVSEAEYRAYTERMGL